MCVRIQDKKNDNETELINNFTNLNNQSTIKLVNRIPKIWEIKALENKSSNESREKLIEREEAYGLKVNISNFLTFFQGTNDPIAIRSKATENIIFAVASLDPQEQSQLGYTKEEFITKCSFNGRQCFVEEFN